MFGVLGGVFFELCWITGWVFVVSVWFWFVVGVDFSFLCFNFIATLWVWFCYVFWVLLVCSVWFGFVGDCVLGLLLVGELRFLIIWI